MKAPWKRGASDSVPTIPIPTLLRQNQTLVIGRSAKIVDWASRNIQNPLLGVHLAMFKMTGVLITWSNLAGLGVPVSRGVLVTLLSALTITS